MTICVSDFLKSVKSSSPLVIDSGPISLAASFHSSEKCSWSLGQDISSSRTGCSACFPNEATPSVELEAKKPAPGAVPLEPFSIPATELLHELPKKTSHPTEWLFAFKGTANASLSCEEVLKPSQNLPDGSAHSV